MDSKKCFIVLGIKVFYIQPGKPAQNAFIERFNRSYRIEVLDARIFNNLIEVREITSEWIEHYNNQRPHESLQNLSPMQYLLKKENSPAQNAISEFSPFQQIHQHQKINEIFYSFTIQNKGVILSNLRGDLHFQVSLHIIETINDELKIIVKWNTRDIEALRIL